MPPSESQSSNSGPEIGAAAAKVAPLRILVVDDDLDLARGTCRLMEQAGYETIIVGTGIGALQAVRDRRPHIVLLDRQLPDMDGLDVCRQIKADPATAGVLVIMVSGHHVQNEEQLTALSTGADGYITRPISNPELRVRIDAFARIARLSLRLTEENAQRQLLEADLENRVRARTAELLAVNQQLEAAQRAAFNSMREAQRAQEELTSSNRQLLWEIAERQRAEAVLRDGEAQVRAMMDATLESIFMMDAGGAVLIANDTVAKRLGVTLGQLVGHNMFDFLPPEVAVRRRAEVEQVLSTGKPVRFEDERLGRWLDHQINPVLDGSGRVTRVVAFGRDITERKQAEEQLQEHERQLATLLRNLPGMAYRCRNDQNWTMAFVSYGCLELTGYAVEDLLNNQRVSYASLIVAEDQARVWEEVQRAVREQRSFQLHYRIRTATGQQKWVWERGGGVFAADGTLEALEGIIADITERKLAEEQLLETNAYLENLINYANAPIIVWDPQFRITRFNHAFESLTGCTEVEVLGKSLEFLFPPALAASSMELIRQTLTGQRWEVVEIRIQHRDGSERTVLWNSATLFAPDGQTPLATIAQGQDITERQHREAEVRELLQQTQRDAHTKAELLKEVNHRVKNNLLAILGIALAEQRQLSAEEKPVAQRFTGNLRRRIEGLLEVHQMLSASLWEPVPVNQLAQQIIQSVLAATPASCQVKLVLQPSTVKASPRQASNLALVFNELATNTVKYALAQRTAAQVTFAAAATESLIRLEYRDDGPGYPPEVLRQERLSVGLMLIRDLTTETLRGQLTLANEAGAVTVLEIKTEEINRT